MTGGLSSNGVDVFCTLLLHLNSPWSSEYKPSCYFKLSNVGDLTTAFCNSFNHKISAYSYSSIFIGPNSFSWTPLTLSYAEIVIQMQLLQP